MLTEKRKKLHWEIVELICVTAIIALFCYGFFYFTSVSVIENYALSKGKPILISEIPDFDAWMKVVCLIASIVVFFFLFLFLIGQKSVYLLNIVRGLEVLRKENLDYEIPLEGNDELTELAENINELSASIRSYMANEEKMKNEKDELVRSLSHDIKTPLTSIISYTEYMKSNCRIEDEKLIGYIDTIHKKADQINQLSNLLLYPARKDDTFFSDAKLLMEQLTQELEESLEESFQLDLDLSGLTCFSGKFDVNKMRRIFDNLSSNIKKYADDKRPVYFNIKNDESRIIITERNNTKEIKHAEVESNKIGLNSLRQIVKYYGGTVDVNGDSDLFEIKLSLLIQK